MKRNVTLGLVQLFLHERKIQTHSSIKSNHFLSCIKVISPNYRDKTPLWHCLHSVMTSKGVWVSQGYSLPVWCYDSQVIVWVTSACLFFEDRISRNTQHILSTKQGSKFLPNSPFKRIWWHRTLESCNSLTSENLIDNVGGQKHILNLAVFFVFFFHKERII